MRTGSPATGRRCRKPWPASTPSWAPSWARDRESGRGPSSSPAEEERFLREARSAAQLHHPGIVAMHDVGRDQQTLFIVSELVRGVSLAEWLRSGWLSFREAADLVAQAADALDYAH